MGHVSYVPREQAAESLRPIYENVEKKFGRMIHLFGAMAHSPELLQGFMVLNGSLNKMQLDPRLRELAYLKVSQVNGCDYCRHYHAQSGQKAGLTAAQVEGVGHLDPGDYDELQWDVLRYADQVTRRVRPDAELVARLKDRLSERELVELTATVALANFTNRMNEALAIELP